MRVIAPRVDKRGIGQLADNRQIGRISRTQYHDTEIVYVNEYELDVNAHKINPLTLLMILYIPQQRLFYFLQRDK